MELLLRFRRAQEWLYPLLFFVIILCSFPFAIKPTPVILKQTGPGLIWMMALLSTLFSLDTVFASEEEDSFLEQLVLSETSLSLMMLLKLVAHWISTQLPVILLAPLLGVLFHLSLTTNLLLMLSLLLGTPILTALSLLGASLILGLKQQGILLGIILLPLSMPVLIFGAGIMEYAARYSNINGPLAFLASLMLFTVTLVPFVIAAVIRIGVAD